jgi:hypothetical protein
MSEFVFYKLREDVSERLRFPSLPFPVRAEMRSRVFRVKDVAFDLLLEELLLFLKVHTHYRDHYRAVAGLLCYVIGQQLVDAGKLDKASRYLELGLRFTPENLELRISSAILFHGLGRREEAELLYDGLIKNPELGPNLMVWILAARLKSELGNHQEAFLLMQKCVPFIPQDETKFWDQFGKMRNTLSQAKPPAEESDWVCSGCLTINPIKKKFCKECGMSRLQSDTWSSKSEPLKFLTEVTIPGPASQKLTVERSEWVCSGCLTINPPKKKFCKECGRSRPQTDTWSSKSDPSKSPTGVTIPGPASQKLTAEGSGWVCSKCSTVNPKKKKFCKECGVSRPS